MRPSTRRLLSLLLSIVFVIAAFSTYSSSLKPEYRRLNTKRGELEAKKELYENQKNIIEGIKQALDQYQGRANLQEAVSQALPNEPDTAFLLYQAVVLAETTGLSVNSIGFSAESEPLVAREETGEFELPEIKTVQVNLELTGTYQGIKDLLRKLETNIRIMDVRSLSITPVFEKGVLEPAFNYSLVIHAYYQSSEEQ